MIKNPWLINIVFFALFIFLAVFLTYPLITHLNQAILGVSFGDGPVFLWNSWWVEKSIFDPSLELFSTDYIYFPQRVSLFFHTLAITNGIFSLPFQHLFGLIVAFNIVYLLSIVLAAFGTFILVKYLTKEYLPAFISGLIFAFNSYFFACSLGHFNLTTIWFFPFLAYFLIKLTETGQNRYILFSALILIFISYNDFQYLIFSLIFISLYFIYVLIKSRRKNFLAVKFCAVILIWLGCFSPMFGKFIFDSDLRFNLKSDIPVVDIDYYSIDPLMFFIPSSLNPVLGSHFGKFSYLRKDIGNSTVYLGFLVLGLAIISIIFQRNKILWFWIIIFVFFIMMSLGPHLHFNGNLVRLKIEKFGINFERIPLPYILLAKIPLLSNLRVPGRFVIFSFLALSVLAGFGFSSLLKRFEQFKIRNLTKFFLYFSVTALVAMFIIFENLATPIRLTSLKIPNIYYKLKEINFNNNASLMELPLGWNTGLRTEGAYRSIFQYYATFHELKLVNGSVSRLADKYIDYYNNFYGMNFLINPVKNDCPPDAEEFEKALGALGINYIIVHKKHYDAHSDIIEKINHCLRKEKAINVFYEDDAEIGYIFLR